MAMQAMQCLVQASSGHMRTVSVMAMKFTLVDGTQPVDAHLPQLMPAMLNHIQDQDRYALSPLMHASSSYYAGSMQNHKDLWYLLMPGVAADAKLPAAADIFFKRRLSSWMLNFTPWCKTHASLVLRQHASALLQFFVLMFSLLYIAQHCIKAPALCYEPLRL